MKHFDIFYYLFIFGSMVLSVIMAPAMFIQQNVLAGWWWVGAFLLFLLMLLYGAIKNIAIQGVVRYETWLGTIIAWVCIIGQWIILFINPRRGLLYNFGLMLLALGSVYVGFWAQQHLSKTTINPSSVDTYAGIPVNEARRNHFGRQ